MSNIPHIPSWADVQIFKNRGMYTWTKPAWAKMVYFNIHNGGGAGGGGASRTSGQGGGGGGTSTGNSIFGINPAAMFPNQLHISVGKGETAAGPGAAGVSNVNNGTVVWSHNFGTGVRIYDSGGQAGGAGGAGTTSAGGVAGNTNSANNTSRVTNFGLCIPSQGGASSMATGTAGSPSGSVGYSNALLLQIMNAGAGGAGISSTNFAGRGGSWDNPASRGSAGSPETNITNRITRGGYGASVPLKGNGIGGSFNSYAPSVSVTFETGETVIVAVTKNLAAATNTYNITVTDGTHTYTPITEFAHNFTGQGSIQLFKADNVTAGTYNITAAIIENGVTQAPTEYIAWYRYTGLSSGPVLASAINTQDGIGGTTNTLICGPLTDTHYNNVQLLLTMNGTHNSTSFTDLSASPKVVTPFGNVKIAAGSTNVGTFKIYGTSGYFDGVNDYLTVSSSPSLALGTGDFTIEGLFTRNGTSPVNSSYALTLLDYRVAEPDVNILLEMPAATNQLNVYVNGTVVITSTSVFSVNNWNHYALVRSSGVTNLYINGVQQGASYTDTNNYTGTAPVIGGRFAPDTGDYRSWYGYLNEFRITVGVARYTATFGTPRFRVATRGPVTSTPYLLFAATSGQNSGETQQRVEPGDTINKFIAPFRPTDKRFTVGVSAGDSLLTSTDPITARFSVYDQYTFRVSAAVLIAIKTDGLEQKAEDGEDGTLLWLPGTIVPMSTGGAGGGSSHFTAGGNGGKGGPGAPGGGGGAGNPGGSGGDGGDGLVIIACW